MTENSIVKTSLSRAMSLCSRREYCSNDIRNKLITWGVSESDTDKIISSLLSENFINDSRYALAFTKDKFSYNRWGKHKIAAHLKTKKLPSELIQRALSSIDDAEYMKVLNNLISAKRKSTRYKNSYELKAKLLRYGLSKGFESHILYDMLNDADD